MCRADPAKASASPCAPLPVSIRSEGSDILAAAGRVPNTAGIGLAEAGVELDAHGYMRVQ
jgi:pyruvate/2-oxoglutarate dehydrogenase complex dihydrolipoamide dehydrogenase (E3) component